MFYPKISIVTPSFNQARYLEETIISVVSQNYPNLEYIIIDGGSTDGSVEIIKKYEKYLYYWISEPDNGHGHALNKGFAKSTGEIMAWINSDDKYYPWTFKTIAEVFTQFEEVEWLTGIPSGFNKKGVLTHATQNFINLFDYLLLNYEWIQQESTFWRRNLWLKAGGMINETYEFMVDGELWSRFFLFACLYNLNGVIGGFRRHDVNRAEQNIQKVHYEMKRAINTLTQKINSDSHKQLNSIKEMIAFKNNHNGNNSIKKILKLLPQFLFNRLSKAIQRKYNENLNDYMNNLDFKDELCYRLIDFIDSKWVINKHKMLIV